MLTLPEEVSARQTPALVMRPELTALLHRFTVEQYHKMIAAGILSADDHVELLEGVVFAMNPILAPHTYSLERTRKALERLAPLGWIVRPQQPVTLAASEPEPDVAVARGTDEDYVERHPLADEIALVIEVGDTTLRRDREFKQAIYASAGLPEYWIINLPERQVEVYTAPAAATETVAAHYRTQMIYPPEARVPCRLGGVLLGEIAVHEILPPIRERP